jgi:hypothetical protein
MFEAASNLKRFHAKTQRGQRRKDMKCDSDEPFVAVFFASLPPLRLCVKPFFVS